VYWSGTVGDSKRSILVRGPVLGISASHGETGDVLVLDGLPHPLGAFSGALSALRIAALEAFAKSLRPDGARCRLCQTPCVTFRPAAETGQCQQMSMSVFCIDGCGIGMGSNRG
jgi:hypothetical protein